MGVPSPHQSGEGARDRAAYEREGGVEEGGGGRRSGPRTKKVAYCLSGAKRRFLPLIDRGTRREAS